MGKPFIKTETLKFPVEERLSNHVTDDIANQLVEVMRTAGIDFLAEHESEFAKMYFHYSELDYMTNPKQEEHLSPADKKQIVRKLYIK